MLVYGITESPPNTPRSNRTSNNLSNLLPILNDIDSSIQNASIEDLYRLGNFDPTKPRPRPILVKFLRRLDVSTILANRSQVKKPIIIKADMSKDERQIESILLQEERWKLIQRGTSSRAAPNVSA